MFATKVEIHTQTEIYENVADDLVSWSTSKSFGVPAGTWNMQLVPRMRDGTTWFEKLSAQDFIRIRVSINNGPFETVMNGLINRVHRDISVNPGTGAVTETIRVTGSDLGKILTQFHVWYNPRKDALHALVMGAPYLSTIIEGFSPAKALEGLLAVVLDDDSNPVVTRLKKRLAEDGMQPAVTAVDLGNKGIKISEELKMNAAIPEDVFANVAEITRFEGAVWNAFTKWGNEPWNEVFVDNGAAVNAEDRAGAGGAPSLRTESDTTYINLRETPFMAGTFDKLVVHEVSYQDIQVPFSVSKGDDDTYTYYFGRPVLTIALGDQTYAQILSSINATFRGEKRADGEDAVSVMERFGFRPLEKEFVYELKGEEEVAGRDGVVALVDDLSSRLFNGFDQNPEFLMGTVGLKPNRLAGNTGRLAKIGHKLRIMENPKGRPPETYYITGVRNEWMFGGNFKQTYDLTRGEYERA
jgi:hypothetical protein